VQRATVGFFSFTEVPAGHHRAYDEWHRLDHMPEQYGIAGVLRGDRWAATPACAAARAVDDPVLGRAHYVTLYVMGEPEGPTLREFGRLAAELRDADRFFAHRQSHLAGAFRVAGTAAAPRVLVRPEVLPWRPATGAYVVVQPAGASGVALDELTAVPGVAGAWSFVPDPALAEAGWPEPDCRLTLAWLDGDPLEVAAELAPVVAAGDVRHAGPFAAVTPSTWSAFDG